MRRSRLLLTVCAVTALTFAILAILVRTRPVSNLPELVVAVGAPYVPLVALTGLALAALARRPVLAVVAMGTVAVTVAVQLPWYYGARPEEPARSTTVRVLSSNLRFGEADPSVFVALASERADVVTVSELTPAAVESFSREGLDDTFPHSELFPRPGAGGIGLYSRYPLDPVSPEQPIDYTMAAARVDVPNVRFDPLIASIHVMSPVASKRNTVENWQSGLAAVKVALTALALDADPGAVIIAGDFNATPDLRQFRDLLTDGYRDAVEQTGAGFTPTFPSRAWHPPLLTIDHVLTRNAAAASVRTAYLPGSDHRSLLADIEVPLDAGR